LLAESAECLLSRFGDGGECALVRFDDGCTRSLRILCAVLGEFRCGFGCCPKAFLGKPSDRLHAYPHGRWQIINDGPADALAYLSRLTEFVRRVVGKVADYFLNLREILLELVVYDNGCSGQHAHADNRCCNGKNHRTEHPRADGADNL